MLITRISLFQVPHPAQNGLEAEQDGDEHVRGRVFAAPAPAGAGPAPADAAILQKLDRQVTGHQGAHFADPGARLEQEQSQQRRRRRRQRRR